MTGNRISIFGVAALGDRRLGVWSRQHRARRDRRFDHRTAEVGHHRWCDQLLDRYESCNIGDEDLLWDDEASDGTPANLHPLMGQNIFRLRTADSSSSVRAGSSTHSSPST